MSVRVGLRILAAIATVTVIFAGVVMFYPARVPHAILTIFGRQAPAWGELWSEMMELKSMVRETFDAEHEMPSNLNSVVTVLNRAEQTAGRGGFKWLTIGRDFLGQKIQFSVRPINTVGDCEITLRSSGPNKIYGDRDDIKVIFIAEVRHRTIGQSTTENPKP